MKIELSKAIRYKDTELKELELDMESITGFQLIEAEEDLRRQGITISAWDYSRPYLIQIASRAMHIPVEVLKSANATDFTRICNIVAGFLLGADTEGLTRVSSANS